jgi:polyisoprenoid-binding protein YceI
MRGVAPLDRKLRTSAVHAPHERVRADGLIGVSGRRPRFGAGVLACTVCAFTATAAPGRPLGPAVVDLDPSHTSVTFTLAGSLHETKGVVPLTAERIEVDPDAAAASGLVVADARATTTGNRLRDATMRDDVLEVGRFPEISFRPTSVDAGSPTGDGDFAGTLRGMLALHGAEHELAVPVHGRLVGDDVTATCRFTIPYVAWGLHDPSVLFLSVAKTVDVEVQAVGRVSRPAAMR